MLKLMLTIAGVGVLIFAFSAPAKAQAGQNCTGLTGDGCVFGYIIAPCPGTFDCFSENAPYLTECHVMTSACPPPGGAGPGCSGGGGSGGSGGSGGGPGGSGGSGGSGGGPGGSGSGKSGSAPFASCSDPISLATGDVYISESDIGIPGLGGGLKLTRTWNSIWPAGESGYQIGMFGPNWKSNFEERVFVGNDHYIKYVRGDGSLWSFGFNINGPGYAIAAPSNESVTMVEGPSNWTMTFEDGEQRTFDNNTGDLTAIIDRNGNTTTLSYDSLGRLATVSDPASRHLYFTYGSGTSLVSSVTTDFGESTSYSYDGSGRLTQVTEPDGSTLSFQYDSNSFISAVLDSTGKVVESYTYDSSGRALGGSRANGVEAVTISYQ